MYETYQQMSVISHTFMHMYKDHHQNTIPIYSNLTTDYAQSHVQFKDAETQTDGKKKIKIW